MSTKVLLLLFFLLLFIAPQYIYGQACDPLMPQDPVSPGNDHGDDRYSYADREVEDLIAFSINPEVRIFKSGYYKEAISIISKFTDNINICDENELYQKNLNKILLIPSGGLFGKENDSTFKEILKQYVRLGGTIVVFAQQQDFHFDILPLPDNENLRAIGWRQDQSCYHGSAYYDQIHPVTSSWITWYNTGSMGTDGYFIDYPSNSTVILRRTKIC